MLILKRIAKYSTSALLMVKVDWLNTPSSAPMELFSTKTILFVIGGSILIALKQKIFILLTTTSQLNAKKILSRVLQLSLKQHMELLHLQKTMHTIMIPK